MTVSQSDKDTEGHGVAGDEIEVDVEGHCHDAAPADDGVTRRPCAAHWPLAL